MHQAIKQRFTKELLTSIGVHFIIQCVQTVMYLLLRNFIVHPDPQTRTFLISLVIFPLLALGLWLIVRPSSVQHGFD